MKNRIGTLFLASAVALAMIGGSYAMWSETIIMSGTVSTGTVDIAWSLDGFGDSEIEGKDVRHISAYIDDDPDNATYGQLIVAIYGAYPCIDYWVDFDVTCVGTVPVHFAVECTPAYLFTSGIITITPASGYGPLAGYDANGNYIGTQLHEDDSWYGRLNFHFDNILWDTVLSPNGWVQGGGPWTFTVTIHGFQYNEVWP